MKPESKRYTTTVGTRTVTFETGKLAGQAGGAVTIGIDDAIVFAAATMGDVREGIDFFPLSVEYEERLYAGGKIPGSSSAARDVPPPKLSSPRALPTALCARSFNMGCAMKCR